MSKTSLMSIVVLGAGVATIWYFVNKNKKEETTFLTGDINGDGIVDMADVLISERISMGLTDANNNPYPSDWVSRADVNKDGIVDSNDINSICDIILGIAVP
jgi:hypothetical protein